MGIDPLSAAAPARVKALILPYARIRQSRFLSFVARLEQENVVQLGTVSADGRPHRTMFSPLAFPTGFVLYDLSISSPSPSHLALSPFELYREPLVVIAICDGAGIEYEAATTLANADKGRDDDTASGDSLKQLLFGGIEKLQTEFSKALIHQIVIFDYEEPNIELPEGVLIVPPPEKSKITTIKTLMCDITSSLLAEMTAFAKSLQALPTIESPKQVRGPLGIQTGSAGTTSAPDSRRSFSPVSEKAGGLQHSMPLQRANPNSRSTTAEFRDAPSGVRTPPTTFEDIAGISLSSSSRPSDGKSRRSDSLDRVSMHGFGAESIGERERNKGRGRIGVVMGSLYLLAGRWPDAVRELSDSATIAKSNSDHLWYAKALDYILVCLLMYAWADMDFRIPQILFPGVEKPGSSSSKTAGNTPSNSSPEVTSAGRIGASNRSLSLQNLTAMLPDLVNQILNLYARAWTFTEDKLPQLAFSESTIRFTKLMAVINLSGGVLDDEGLRQIVVNQSRTLVQSLPPQIKSFPTKAELTTVLFRAFPSASTSSVVPIEDRTVILAAIASVLSELGYHRKKALVLKELLSALIPALVQARKENAAEIGLHPAASLATLTMPTRMRTSRDAHTRDRLEDGLQGFLAVICNVYGIPIFRSDVYGTDPHLHGHDDEAHNRLHQNMPEVIAARLLREAALKLAGNQYLKLEILRSCISICEALPDLEGVLRFSAEMLRTAGSGIAPGPETNDGSPALPIEDQVHLVTQIARIDALAQQLGKEEISAEYWDEFLIRVIELVEGDPAQIPVAHTKTDLEVVKDADAKAKKTPFLYNPFAKPTSSSLPKTLLVAEEEAVFRVTLQNLYDIDVDVERISLEAGGLPFDSSSQSTTIGPYGTQKVLLRGIPKKSGSLNIIGCKVKIKGCRERSFPIFNKAWTPKADVKIGRSDIGPSLAEKASKGFEDAEPSRAKKPSDPHGPESTILALDVIKAQPKIDVKSTSQPQSAIMLLEGEAKLINVTLQNTSPIPSDVLFLSFNDSTISQLRSSTTDNEPSPLEIYEIEYASFFRQALRWRRAGNDNIIIGAKMDTMLEVEVLGKPGLSFGTIQVDYGHLGDACQEGSEKIYTRQLIIPLTMTVNASIELIRNEIVPLDSGFAWCNKSDQGSTPQTDIKALAALKSRPSLANQRAPNPKNCFHSLLSRIGLKGQEESHCLLLLDLRNSWPSPLNVSIQIRSPSSNSQLDSPWERAYTVHELIQPGHISRILLVLPRIYVPNPYAPIPSLSPDSKKRQFIVSTAPKPAPEAEIASREAFHYREAVLSRTSATWEEESTGRRGIINLRALHFTTRMVSALRLDDLEISLSIHQNTSTLSCTSRQIVQQISPTKYLVPTSTFLTLRTTLYNRSTYPIHPLLRLQPALKDQPHNIALDLSKKFLWNGVLQRALRILGPGETSSVDLSFLVLCKGVFELGAVVEEVRVLRPDMEEGEREGDKLLGETERRVWGVRERCMLVAKDFEKEVDHHGDDDDNDDDDD